MGTRATCASNRTFQASPYLTVATAGYLPDRLFVDGKWELKRSACRGGVHWYHPVDRFVDWRGEVVFLKASIEVELANFLAPVLSVKLSHQRQDRLFERRLDRYYLPRVPSPDIVEKFFDGIAGEYEDAVSIGLNEGVYRRLLLLVKRGFDRGPTFKLLDYGVGTGISFRLFGKNRTNQLFGADMSSEMVRICHKRGFSTVKKGSYCTAPFPSNFFDAVTASFVVHFFVDDKPFHEIARVLKPKGRLAFNLPKPDPGFRQHYLELLTKCSFARFRFHESKITSDGVTRVIPFIGAQKNSS